MKKILYSLLALAATVAACTDFAEDEKIDFAATDAPVVAATVVDDNTVSVSVTPKEGNVYYSYVLIAGPAKELKAETVLKGGYESDAVANEKKEPVAAVLKASETKSVSFQVGGLKSNTAYTLYAVASNSQGVVSKLATSTAVTTDGTVPVLTEYDFQSTATNLDYVLVFDDPIAFTGKGTVTAHYYARHSKAGADGNLVEYKKAVVPADSLVISGKNLYVSLDAAEAIPGAIVAISYTEGLVANLVGGRVEAFTDVTVSSKLESEGLVASYKTQPFALGLTEDEPQEGSGIEGGDEEEPEVTFFSDWEELDMVTYSYNKYPLAGKLKAAKLSIETEDANGRVVAYTGQQLKIAAANKLSVKIDEDPGFGSYVSYKIAAGSIVDIFGNTNSEFTAEKLYFCSYGYKLADVLGTYTVTGVGVMTGLPVSYKLVIAETDDAEKGDLLITNFLGFEGKFYADFDPDNGTVKIYEFSKIDDKYLVFFNKAGDQLFSIPSPGVLTSDAYVLVVTYEGNNLTGYAKDGNGYDVVIENFRATRN